MSKENLTPDPYRYPRAKRNKPLRRPSFRLLPTRKHFSISSSEIEISGSGLAMKIIICSIRLGGHGATSVNRNFDTSITKFAFEFEKGGIEFAFVFVLVRFRGIQNDGRIAVIEQVGYVASLSTNFWKMSAGSFFTDWVNSSMAIFCSKVFQCIDDGRLSLDGVSKSECSLV